MTPEQPRRSCRCLPSASSCPCPLDGGNSEKRRCKGAAGGPFLLLRTVGFQIHQCLFRPVL